MKLEIENIKINKVIDILDKLVLTGLKSIHRTRLSQKLTEKLQRVVEEEKEIRKEQCHLDEKGNPKLKEDNSLDVKDITEFNKVMSEFYTEKVIVSSDEDQVMLKSVKESLENSDTELNGEEAYSFEHLYSGFVSGESEVKKGD